MFRCKHCSTATRAPESQPVSPVALNRTWLVRSKVDCLSVGHCTLTFPLVPCFAVAPTVQAYKELLNSVVYRKPLLYFMN